LDAICAAQCAWSASWFPRSNSEQEVSEVRPAAAGPHESLRAAFDAGVKQYADDHYPNGVSSVRDVHVVVSRRVLFLCCSTHPWLDAHPIWQVYVVGDEIVICIEDHKFQPRNFWNGRWRSEWCVLWCACVCVCVCVVGVWGEVARWELRHLAIQT
jgi:hypothetical protein